MFLRSWFRELGQRCLEVRVNYYELRHEARVLEDHGGYSLMAGQTNPVIVRELLLMVEMDLFLPDVVWEPFAGHHGECRSQDIAKNMGVQLISQDIKPSDPRVLCADSTKVGPGTTIGGVVLHPPYYGSKLFSDVEGELSLHGRENDYWADLRRVIGLVVDHLVMHGCVAAVCRRYRYGGREIKMDEKMNELLTDHGFELESVWMSEPDIVLVSRRVR